MSKNVQPSNLSLGDRIPQDPLRRGELGDDTDLFVNCVLQKEMKNELNTRGRPRLRSCLSWSARYQCMISI